MEQIRLFRIAAVDWGIGIYLPGVSTRNAGRRRIPDTPLTRKYGRSSLLPRCVVPVEAGIGRAGRREQIQPQEEVFTDPEN